MVVKDQLRTYLEQLCEQGGSDLHLKVGSPPRIRVAGALRRLEGEQVTPEFTAELGGEIMRDHHIEAFENRSEVDFAFSVRGVGRFRVNAYRQRGSVGLVFHRVRMQAVGLEELALPAVVKLLADDARGLVIVAGGTGSGKTTTMAAMVDYINRTKEVHIITIEDPIEVIHSDQIASVSQREIGFDTNDFSGALTAALHQDPDVILVGELRDQESADLILSAAESGHLVITSLNTPDAPTTINRFLDFFPSSQQLQVRARISNVLRGTICQRLVPRSDGKGRVAAVEVMVANEKIRACIMEPDSTQSLRRLIAEGGFFGMQTFDESLTKLYEDGLIDLQKATQTSGLSGMRSSATGQVMVAPTPPRAV